MQIQIPEYLLREWHRHLKRIVENATYERADTRTANAFRLARKDLRRMNKLLPDNDKAGKIQGEA